MSSRVRLRASFLLLTGVLAVVGAASPASAHTGFESSKPADGERSDVPVAEIVLTFTGPADPAGEGFVVLDPSGAVRIPDRVAVDADRQIWTLGFSPPLASGAVGVRWTVQAPDGHPINGAFSFTAGDAEPTTTATVDETPPTRRAGTSASTSTPGQESRPAATSAGVEADDSALGAAALDLESFLAEGGATPSAADGIGAAGRFIGLLGTMLTIGGLAFAATVVRDHRQDRRSVLTAVGLAAVAIVAGTVIDLIARVAVATGGWGGVLELGGFESVATSTFGVAAGLRVTTGALLFAAVRETRPPLAPTLVAPEVRESVTVGAEASGRGVQGGTLPAHGLADGGRPGGRTVPGGPAVPTDDPVRPWWPLTPVVLVLVLALVVSFAFDGHTVTEGNRWITGAVDMIHVVAASIWAGGVVALSLVLWRRHRRAEQADGLELALRFSTIAGAGLALAGIAGVALTAIILEQVSQVWTTPWGRLLIAKTLVVASAAAVGAYNHFVVIPQMHEVPDDGAQSFGLRKTVTAEAILLISVIALTAVLIGASSQT